MDTESGFNVVKSEEFKSFEALTITYSALTNELWVGDKKGSIQILNADDFTVK